MTKDLKLFLLAMIGLSSVLAGCGRPQGNASPIVGSLKISPNPVVPGGTMSAVAMASDPDGDVLHYSWTVSQGWSVTGYGTTATVAAPSTNNAAGYVTVTVDDGNGKTAHASLGVSTQAGSIIISSLPVISSITALPNPVGRGGAMNISVSAADTYGYTLGYTWTVTTGWTMNYGQGTPRINVTSPDTYASSGTVSVTVDDGHGGITSGSIDVSTVGNSVPVISSITASPNPAGINQTIAISAAVSDPDGDALGYTWTATTGWQITGYGATATATAPSTYSTGGSVTVTVDDGYGGTASSTIAISTIANSAPVIASISASPNPVTPNGVIAVAASASDPDGDALTYSWTTSPGWAVTGNGATALVVAPSSYSAGGSVTVTVDDGHGGVASASIGVSTIGNSAPVISSITASPNPTATNQTITAIVTASDPDGDALTYTWTVSSGWGITSSGPTAWAFPPSIHNMSGYITVTVYDGQGGAAIGSVAIGTTPQWPPFITSISISPQPVILSTLLSCNASDPDGDSLSYLWDIGGLGVASGSSAIWSSPGIPGYYDVTVAVSDGYGAEVTGSSSVVMSSGSSWPRFHRDIGSTGLSPINTASTTGALAWAYATGDYVYSSPVIGWDGTIYVGSEDGRLYAVSPNGGSRWSYATGGPIWYSSPAVSANGTIYIGSSDGSLYAIGSDGSLDWKYPTGGPIWYSSPAIGADGTVYIGSSDGKLYAIGSGGGLKWSYTTGNQVYSSPAIGADGTVYIGSGDGSLYAIDPAGTFKWSYPTGGSIDSSPAIGADGTVYIGSSDGKLYAINPKGGLDWSYTTGGSIGHSSPAIGGNGTIYIGSNSGTLYAIFSTGSLDWTYTTGGVINSSPAVSGDGIVYVGSEDGRLYAINPDGTSKWSYPTGGSIDSSPAIGADGTIYVGSADFTLYAIH
ncbi:MAG: PQQ-binding-like beta-propeller repeat protein [Deltaproteobacteria bacterium]|nr:PQQ-binding-like beta-propeller repeat protein [Deltaproteobacteria bacterium]MCL5276732.1 PQQ-binding-like beta-propeller repeat protein [Deltaproteobacteria bacterium]